jgi:DNA-binding response OmpR family regulator
VNIEVNKIMNPEYLLEAIELQLVKYLIKPVKEHEFKEALDLCIESINNDTSNIFKLNEACTFDIFNHTLVVDKQLIKLRTKEIEFLTLLLKNKNRYVTYSEIENYVWNDSVMSKDALKTLVKNIKTKIPKELIVNLSGTGYKIDL